MNCIHRVMILQIVPVGRRPSSTVKLTTISSKNLLRLRMLTSITLFFSLTTNTVSWFCCNALYIHWALDRSTHIVIGSSWRLWYFILMWTREAKIPSLMVKGLPKMHLYTLLHETPINYRPTIFCVSSFSKCYYELYKFPWAGTVTLKACSLELV